MKNDFRKLLLKLKTYEPHWAFIGEWRSALNVLIATFDGSEDSFEFEKRQKK